MTGMIEWGQNSRPKKIQRASNITQKIPRSKINPSKINSKKVCLYFIHRKTQPKHYHECSDCFKYPKTSLLKSKKYLPNFPTQKNPGIENYEPKKILRSSPSLKIPSTPPGLGSKVSFQRTQHNNPGNGSNPPSLAC